MSFSALNSAFLSPKLKLKNRLIMAPMSRYFCDNNIPNQQVVDYYAKRAAADVGLIITEGTFIPHPSAAGYKNVPYFWGDALNGWKKVVEAVHQQGGKIFPQLWHVGSFREKNSGWQPQHQAFSPSGVTNDFNHVTPSSMSLDDINAVIEAYVQAAKDAQAIGFDGIEIHAAHGYLIDEFFWHKTNQRDDIYGGDQAARNRFAIEIISAIRAAVGEDFPIALRISQWKQQDYQAQVAENLAQLEAWLKPLSVAGVDIFHVSTRRFWQPAFAGSNKTLAHCVKDITHKPVIMVGSIGLDSTSFDGAQPQSIEQAITALEQQHCDLIAVGRALLAEPQWLEKIQQGDLQAIRHYQRQQLEHLD